MPFLGILLSGAGGAMAASITRMFSGDPVPQSANYLSGINGGFVKYLLGGFALLVVWRVLTSFLKWVF